MSITYTFNQQLSEVNTQKGMKHVFPSLSRADNVTEKGTLPHGRRTGRDLPHLTRKTSSTEQWDNGQQSYDRRCPTQQVCLAKHHAKEAESGFLSVETSYPIKTRSLLMWDILRDVIPRRPGLAPSKPGTESDRVNTICSHSLHAPVQSLQGSWKQCGKHPVIFRKIIF